MCGGGSSACQASASVADRSPSAVSHAVCQPATAPAQSATGSFTRRSVGGLGAQHDFEGGTKTRLRGERESALDGVRACTNVLQALPCCCRLAVEALAVVAHRHEALVVARADHDFGTGGVRVLAHVGETLLHDSEDLDLLVRCEPDVGIDLEVDLELPLCGQDLDVPAQCCVERCAPGGGR